METIDLSNREEVEKLRKSELLDILENLRKELSKRKEEVKSLNKELERRASSVAVIKLEAELEGARKEIIRLKTKYERTIGLGATRNEKA